MGDFLILAMIAVIGFASGLLTGYELFEIFHKNARIESDPDARGIGVLYIYEGPDRDRYSFAFDCPLDQIGNFKKVTLEVKKKHEKSLPDIESDLFAKDFGSNMD